MIHPAAIVMPGATVGDDVTIEPYAVVYPKTYIGAGAYIGSHAVIGAPAQSDGFAPAGDSPCPYGVKILSGAIVREHSQVHCGLLSDTIIGRDAHVMAASHIAHDCFIGDDTTISTGSTLGGFTMIGCDANLGQNVVTHPWVIIGDGAMIGLNSSVIRDVLPFQKVAGSPSRLLGSNQHKDASLPAEYDPSRVSDEAWAGWNMMLVLRDALREAWSNR